MRNYVAALASFTAVLLGCASAVAATDRFDGEGVSLRFLAERPGADGRFRAALLVDLKPGWKTYWLDPGEAGIPPALRLVGASQVTASYPVPHRFDDGVSKSIVYSAPFAIAFDGRLAPGATGAQIEATLGLCQEICIPVAVKLDAELASDVEARGMIAAAFAALPEASTPDAGIVAARLDGDGDALRVEVRPTSASEVADLFVSAPKGWSFGPPRWTTGNGADGTALAVLPVVGKPRKAVAVEPFAIEAILAGPRGAWRASGLPAER